MKIAIDAMGGDYAPEEIIKGVVLASDQKDFEIIVLGKESEIKNELNKYDFRKNSISIIDCKETIDAGELPLNAVKTKKDSTILVGMKLIKDKKVDAFISAGNSGAMMAAALLQLGCISKLRRPAIATVLPSLKGKVVILDVGANVDCKPEHLLQFANIGTKYAKYILKNNNPNVGLLNIGEEENKGNKFSQNAYKILKGSNINFHGNVEGKDVFKGKVDVVVCDGFTGNVLIKLSEGLAKMLFKEINDKIVDKLPKNMEMNKFRKSFMDIVKSTDYTEIGGLPLLGIDGLCFVCHGRSKAKTIKNAIFNAVNFVHSDILNHLKEN
ncbi:MAG: phosphate acyltransferase PlsX [Candidatus Caldatribacteriota bacterium]|nr:phosphate acyltransferase PlsX [Candidatus Caldatribacteriota bacterium]